MPINQKRVVNVSRDDGQLFYIDLGYVVYDINSSASGQISWFYDPKIAFGV